MPCRSTLRLHSGFVPRRFRHDRALPLNESRLQDMPLRTRLAIYGSGLFSDGATSVVVPLWVLFLDPSPLAFGIAIGAGSLLPFLLSIHGGVLMDRLGARRVMLAFAALGLVLPILFPLMPWIWAAILLNLVIGLSSTMNWVGAQTLVGQILRGDPALTWRVSFCNRLGHFICPILAGIMWDLFGPWGGFGVTLLWAILFMVSTLMLPHAGTDSGTHPDRDDAVGAAVGQTSSIRGFRWGDLVPRLADYRRAFALLGIPLVAVAATGSVLNIAVSAIQGSFFIAHMREIGLTGTLIGFIFAGLNMSALCGTAMVSPAARRLGDVRLLNLTVVAAIALMTLTPLFTAFLPLLLITLLRGYMHGTSQPLMIMIPSRMVPAEEQGAVVGMRICLNRLMMTVLPPLMGGIVALAGLTGAFWVLGGFLFLLACGLWAIFRPPAFTPPVPDRAS